MHGRSHNCSYKWTGVKIIDFKKALRRALLINTNVKVRVLHALISSRICAGIVTHPISKYSVIFPCHSLVGGVGSLIAVSSHPDSC